MELYEGILGGCQQTEHNGGNGTGQPHSDGGCRGYNDTV